MRFNYLTIVAVIGASLVAPMASADLLSDATKLGGNAGAMTYCENNFATGSDRAAYNRLGLLAFRELDKLSTAGKAKALIVKKATEDNGVYLGKKLNPQSCTSLRKLLSISLLNN